MFLWYSARKPFKSTSPMVMKGHRLGAGTTLTGCLASGDGPGFGHLPDLVSLLCPSSGFGLQFCLPDFSSNGFQIPPQPDISRTGVTPVRGHAVTRVAVKDGCALVLWEEERRF